MLRHRSVAVLLACVPAVAVAGHPPRPGSAIPDPSRIDGIDFSKAAGRYVFLLNVDALNERTFHQLLDRGELPNIARMLSEKHGDVGRLVSAFPSSSAPAIPEMFDGRFLDRSETLPRKVHAFDRQSRQALRYTFKDREWVDDQIDIWDITSAGHIPTFTCFLRQYEGVARHRFRQKYLAWDSLFEFLKMPRVMNFDKRNLRDAAKLVRSGATVPQLAYIWCDTLDVTGHIHGPYSEVYRRSLRDIDRGFGWLFDAMRARRLPEGDSLYDRASILIFGDHGLSPSQSLIDVGGRLKALGLKVRDTSHVTQFISEYMGRDWADRVDAVFVPGGSTVAELYLRGGRRDPWTDRMSLAELCHYAVPGAPAGVDLPAVLAALPGMDMVLVREDDGAVRLVTSDRGEARVLMRHDTTEAPPELYAYVPIGDGDPLGYRTDPIAAPLVSPQVGPVRWANGRAWLLATLHTAHPWAVARIPHAFGRHATESDVITVARRGYDFLARSRGDHGGLDPETMFTPLVIASSGRAPLAGMPLLTTVDMLPTVLSLLGIAPSQDLAACLDGTPFGITAEGDEAALRVAVASLGAAPPSAALPGAK